MQEQNPGGSLDVGKLLELVEDTSAKPDVEKKFSDPKQLIRATLRSIYDERRWRAQNDFFEAAYQNYKRDNLERRPFLIYGAGKFRHKHWRTADVVKDPARGEPQAATGRAADVDYSWDQHYANPLPVEDGTMSAIYANHVVDYADNISNDFLFRDVHRLLRKGGIFRLTSCNVDLGLRAARASDFAYYVMMQAQRGDKAYIKSLGAGGTPTPIEWYILESCSLVTRKENSTYYPPELCADFLWSDANVYNALDLAAELSDSSLRDATRSRVNWSNPAKIIRMLRAAGFSETVNSGYAQSCCPIFRDSRYFDTISPTMSWYVDAIK